MKNDAYARHESNKYLILFGSRQTLLSDLQYEHSPRSTNAFQKLHVVFDISTTRFVKRTFSYSDGQNFTKH